MTDEPKFMGWLSSDVLRAASNPITLSRDDYPYRGNRQVDGTMSLYPLRLHVTPVAVDWRSALWRNGTARD